jgi:hypothetical protein
MSTAVFDTTSTATLQAVPLLASLSARVLPLLA